MRSTVIALLLMLSNVAIAVDSRQLSTPERQEAYEHLTAELRCLVCQNQTIGDSNAELASDLRRQVQEMLEQGKSEQNIIDFMTERYGDFVLYKPPFKAKTSLLWLGPGLFLLIGILTVFFVVRRKNLSPSDAGIKINSDKQNKINNFLEEGDDS